MKHLTFALILVALAACQPNEKKENPKALLDTLTHDYWQRELATGRAIKITGGKSPWPDRLYTGSAAEFKDDSVYFSNLIGQLQEIDGAALPEDSRIELDLLKWVATTRLEATRHYANTFPLITPYAHHLSSGDMIFKQATFESATDVAEYLRLLGQFPESQRLDLSKLRAMELRGIRLAKPEIELTLQLIKTLQVAPEQHPYFPASARLQKLDTATQRDFQQKAATLLANDILPLHDSLANYLNGDYLANASATVGLGQYPGGKEYYRFLVQWHTTTDLTPEEIHAIGNKQVESISRQIDSIRTATGFKGDKKAFYTFLQKDKRFLAKTPDEVGERLKAPLRRMDTVIYKLISLKPKAGYDVRRLPLALEPAMTFGNYLPPSGDEKLGVYYFNGSKLDQRPLTSAASLAFHEITPGHHWQVNLQSENAALSEFRQNMMVTAYSEGWGDYASYLGIELGLYNDPYDYCGRLLMDMFISVRLVVDTGMNYLGWTREEAMDYMRNYLIESEEQIKTESIRYSCDIPAQALGYKIGSLKLLELRRKYQQALGAGFDVRQFHDHILSRGNLPLSVLEQSLDRAYGVN